MTKVCGGTPPARVRREERRQNGPDRARQRTRKKRNVSMLRQASIEVRLNGIGVQGRARERKKVRKRGILKLNTSIWGAEAMRRVRPRRECVSEKRVSPSRGRRREISIQGIDGARPVDRRGRDTRDNRGVIREKVLSIDRGNPGKGMPR